MLGARELDFPRSLFQVAVDAIGGSTPLVCYTRFPVFGGISSRPTVVEMPQRVPAPSARKSSFVPSAEANLDYLQLPLLRLVLVCVLLGDRRDGVARLPD